MLAPATFDRKSTPQVEDGDSLFFGLNSRLEAENLSPGYVSAAVNVRMRSGQIEPRLGVVKPGWLNRINPGVDNKIYPVGKFYGAGAFKDPSSIEWSFTAADGQIYRHRPHNARFAVPLPTGVRALSRVTFTQAFNKLYCFRGRHLAPLVLPDIDTGFTDILPHYDSGTAYDAAVIVTGQEAEEIAYGPFESISSLTSVGDIATVVTSAVHGYVTGADITIQGATETGYNGRWNITVLDDVTFTFQFPGASASPATGTPKCSNMSHYWQALGSKITLTSLTSSSTTATATKNGHGFTTGQYVTIAGATQAEYNGTFHITVVDANTFTYVFAGSGTTPATGTITAQTSIVLAGQSPDTNPEAWQQIFNILPNADDALFINNRLLVPTAFTPGVNGYDASSSYTKKDFIVATDIQDDVHFDFQNEFRINQGSDDEIVTLVKYAPDTAIAIKGKSWGVLSNIGIDLSNLALDMHTDGYGGCAASAVVAGKDVVFPVSKRGLVSIQQNQLGQMRSVDIPFTNDIAKEVARINWNYADKIRVAYWDDKLYAAVPLDSGRAQSNDVLVATGSGNNRANTFYFKSSDTLYVGGDAQTIQFLDGQWVLILDGDHAYTSPTLTGQWATADNNDGVPPPPLVSFLTSGISNNALLVYDYRAGDSGAWQSVDMGDAICPQEFFKATYNGVERLFFIGADGYANMAEEATSGDYVPSRTDSATGLDIVPIVTSVDSRGYRFDTEAQKNFKMLQCVLGVWGAQYSVSRYTGAANTLQTLVADKSFSRLAYLRPFNRAAYVEGNLNNDFATAGRGNYTVILPAGLSLGTDGISCAQYQEVTERVALFKTLHRYTVARITNAQGRCVVKSITPVAAEGQRRGGSFI